MQTAKFAIGQIVYHRRFNYRGVIYDVDSAFSGSKEWYEKIATSCPPKDKPWYHILVDNMDYNTYVAERHLEATDSKAPICHPLIDHYFGNFVDGHYLLVRQTN